MRLKSRRKRIFVNARAQGGVVLRVAAYWIMYHIVLWHGLFVFRYAQVRMSTDETLLREPVNSLYWQFCIDHLPLLMASLLIMPLFMLDFIRLTHRIVGPLLRANNTLRKLMCGEPVSHVEFRKGDLLPEFQTTFNDFLAFYEQDRINSACPVRLAAVLPGDQAMTESQAEVLQSALQGGSPAPVQVGV